MTKFVLIVILIISTSAFSQTGYYDLLRQVDDIENELENNERILRSRRGASKRIEIQRILSNAYSEVNRTLRRRGGGNVDRETLLRIKSMCKAPTSWSEEARCYKNAFRERRDRTSQVLNSCIVIQTSENVSRCYTDGITRAVENSVKEEDIVRSACKAANSWSDEALCFKEFGANIERGNPLEVIASGCAKVRTSENTSRCFYEGLSDFTGNSLSQKIKSSCKAANSWSDEALCFDGAVSAGISYDRFFRTIYDSCNRIRSSESKSRCYYNGL